MRQCQADEFSFVIIPQIVVFESKVKGFENFFNQCSEKIPHIIGFPKILQKCWHNLGNSPDFKYSPYYSKKKCQIPHIKAAVYPIIAYTIEYTHFYIMNADSLHKYTRIQNQILKYRTNLTWFISSVWNSYTFTGKSHIILS